MSSLERYCLIFIVIFVSFISTAAGITCYECQSSQGQDCKYHGQTCAYGMFGCIKVAAYSGGVDKLGNFYDQDRSIVMMMRGCNILPIGGVDACQQQSLVGYRLLTCYCFTDYCNASPSSKTLSWNLLLIPLLLFIWI